MTYRGKTIADVLGMRVETAAEFLADVPAASRSLQTLLDEPTTGLHPQDVRLLLAQLNRLVDNGNTVVVVEHSMNVVAAADWVIDMGPSGGDDGGRIICAGTPAEVAACDASRTAPYLTAALKTLG